MAVWEVAEAGLVEGAASWEEATTGWKVHAVAWDAATASREEAAAIGYTRARMGFARHSQAAGKKCQKKVVGPKFYFLKVIY